MWYLLSSEVITSFDLLFYAFKFRLVFLIIFSAYIIKVIIDVILLRIIKAQHKKSNVKYSNFLILHVFSFPQDIL